MIILYTTHCPKCRVVEMKLKQKNIPYTENTDVNEMLALNIHSAPALKVDDSIYEFKEAIDWINNN